MKERKRLSVMIESLRELGDAALRNAAGAGDTHDCDTEDDCETEGEECLNTEAPTCSTCPSTCALTFASAKTCPHCC